MRPRAVYIHIPFCTQKCHYCDFTAYVVDGQPVDDYLTALEKEMKMITKEVPPGQIEAIFIGGGTPTVLTPTQMERLLMGIQKHFPEQSPSIEFTIEANPGTTTPELLTVMKKGGINRISFGVQTFRNTLLREIGRIHDNADIKRSVQQARQAGFQNISLDLMFGLPQQTVADMEETLIEAMKLSPDHISCYSLKVEEGTLFHHLQERKELPLPSEEEEFEMYQLVRSFLVQQGYHQYEVSNFAKPGYESTHNLTYWKNESYYGLGTGAHGYVKPTRYMNIKGVKEYIRQIEGEQRPIADQFSERLEEEIENFMMLGLRLLDGISKQTFYERFGFDVDQIFQAEISDLINQGFLYLEGDRISLTEKGLIFGNHVFGTFIGTLDKIEHK
ncbi:oxygen-independent coproporphyrinogen III oxidase [Hazenella sp. IB182357]|uniref:Heme chaperone HemW n=1 Tax=Polycladospora coralii TaxID=2771432 RepID=A0A926N7U2_9BACL|nr:radical SAM family heme chaperone HemW [Polycladospora coralii]MBD1371138.1 oxygen-independent coproporphyrinogen III oxidase [Polycladospora coralii]MBS7530080.1 oxygen-independent coproporphyrinogen III oxidase [Polycladospora coralii]